MNKRLSDKEIIKGGIMLTALDIICNGGKVTVAAMDILSKMMEAKKHEQNK